MVRTSAELASKAAGYMLAAANAQKREEKASKNLPIITKTTTKTITKTITKTMTNKK
jgi:hypothetical protein